MKKNIFALSLFFALAGCDLGGIRGNGHLVTEERKLDPFVNIEAGGAFRVDWHSGPPSVSITIDENLMQYVEMEVRDKVFHVRTTRSIRPRHSIKLTLTSSALEGASFSGASRLTAHQLTGSKFYIETMGASNVTLDGAVDELVANLTGASDLRAESLQTKSAVLSVTGAGDARIAVSDSLKASITGAGKVEYIGNPTHLEREITGAGSIRRRGGGPSAGPVVLGRSHD
jgi:Putative auto-transporter adhesin, head GIN domain